ncbi:MAG: hypothetical protein JXR78_16675 [Victivallales bacterium]|nr:hypothetical protein [Victivallales bacterium]
MQKNKENAVETSRIPGMSRSIPATEEQRDLLRLAIKKQWLHPNTFIGGNYEKWEKLSVDEAEQFLATLPPEKRERLEMELKTPKKHNHYGRDIARGAGRGVEDAFRQIGYSIDGGIS